jgi:F-type H+-transporting ATPase subunit gamma
VKGKVDAVYVAYMNFISAGSQKPDVVQLLPLSSVEAKTAKPQTAAPALHVSTLYDFYPNAQELLDELLPQTVKAAMFQAFLDSVTSENVARMIAMKSATDNADKMVKSLTMEYNRARQSQITTELSEIMGGVEAMKG